MAISTSIAIYFLIWWVALFVVLPWGVRPQDQQDTAPGTDPGAPRVPRVLAKLLWTTVVTTVVWGACAVIYVKGWITLDDMVGWMGITQR